MGSSYIPGLYCPPAHPADRNKADDINKRLTHWLEHDLGVTESFMDADPGRGAVLYHPDAAGTEHLLAAAMLLVAENVVDDYICETEHGGTHERRGALLVLCQAAVDPPALPPAYMTGWTSTLSQCAPVKAMHSAMRHFSAIATPQQRHRLRQDLCDLYLGYAGEGDYGTRHHTPPVWEYLIQRQFNNFRPCLTITDAIGGYELPAEVFADPAVQYATALACNVTTACNDLYSLRKELASERFHYSLPTVIAAEEGCSITDAFARAVRIHNELLLMFEEQARILAPTDAVLARFLAGLMNWVTGNHEWHAGLVGRRYATAP
ncbi:cyclase [Streptomyces sp. NPDC052236]|uniref:terpene synthase family protein n=1 Tax=Streptomyces sp. NPDC052236 TaxID=3365686 RepID=UPI0037D7B523